MEISELTDIELIKKTREGDQSAFTVIVKRYKPRIASTINGMIGKCDDADDIGQEVFIRFYNNMENFRGEASLSTYLTRIAINLSLNEIKRRKLKRILSLEKILEEGRDVMDNDSKSDSGNNKEIIHQAIKKLNSKYRTVLVLRLIDEYSTEETAQILKVPVGTVLSRLARAQVKLREYLKPYLSEL